MGFYLNKTLSLIFYTIVFFNPVMVSDNGAINEKRLKPIYDCLDFGNNKKAVSEAEKVIKKHNLMAAKALKVIGLFRGGKMNEAYLYAQQVIKLKPHDDNSLQALSTYFKESCKTEEICPLYEQAVEIDNNPSEEILTHLFMSYVRCSNFQKMKTTALKLYRKFKNSPYHFWGTMASVLQAHFCENKDLALKMHLPLAERMLEKYMKENNCESSAEVELWLLILEKMGKTEKAMEVLESDLAKRVLKSELVGFTPKKLEYQLKLKKYEEVNIASQKLLLDNVADSWNYVLIYLDSFEGLIRSVKDEPQETESNGTTRKEHTSFNEAVMLIEKVQEESATGKRAPYLLPLELAKRFSQDGSLLEKAYEAGLKHPIELLTDYCSFYLHKPCCFDDLRIYLFLLNNNEEIHQSFIARLKEIRQNKFDEEKQNYDCTREINIAKFERYLGIHDQLSNEEKLLKAKQYYDLYKMHKGTHFIKSTY